MPRGVTKTISVSDDAYEMLARAKRPGETFSDLAKRLVKAEIERRLFDPSLKVELSEQEAENWKESIYRARDGSNDPRVVFD